MNNTSDIINNKRVLSKIQDRSSVVTKFMYTLSSSQMVPFLDFSQNVLIIIKIFSVSLDYFLPQVHHVKMKRNQLIKVGNQDYNWTLTPRIKMGAFRIHIEFSKQT